MVRKGQVIKKEGIIQVEEEKEKLTPEQQFVESNPQLKEAIQTAIENDKMGKRVICSLTKEDFNYFKNLTINEMDAMKAIANYEIQKNNAIAYYQQLQEELKRFEQQLHVKYDLEEGRNYNIDMATMEIVTYERS